MILRYCYCKLVRGSLCLTDIIIIIRSKGSQPRKDQEPPFSKKHKPPPLELTTAARAEGGRTGLEQKEKEKKNKKGKDWGPFQANTSTTMTVTIIIIRPIPYHPNKPRGERTQPREDPHRGRIVMGRYAR
jgi:hypothetical protein